MRDFMKILIIEDEKRLSESIKKGLLEAGFSVDQSFDGEDGLFLATSENYDCIILDIMLPKMDGIEICQKLRQEKKLTPILMLTAKSAVEDITKGLDSGADDYLAKPFSFIELKSRIHALIRRNYKQISPILKISDLELDPIKHLVTHGGNEINLTPKEFAILEFLMRHQGETVTRTAIIEHAWNYSFDGLSNVVDVFITSLRKKIGQQSGQKLIQTIHGVGFRMK